nr:MAG TPA_asm: hypothetical protein [Caudoviricetes sp.]
MLASYVTEENCPLFAPSELKTSIKLDNIHFLTL